ncbi:hypothetical protein Q5W_16295 [Hydrogenophaga sp. PBC]|uniref:hypothetical protein n=1 Tax=Hydrogenophaga sp. PBC TaxID=795665 RepID=UPI000854F74B|nr:hypothetical protein [Hydrogenophaga sp. PBC]AOS80418.1 hypothetical protein Q5W_16295 [Hydrogenophaga sp. PBC]
MIRKTAIAVGLLAAAALAQAKLPAPPPPPPEAAAKADEAKARAAYNTKVEAYKLCKAMDKAAANHFKTTAGAGKQPTAGAPACTDPGAFAYTPPKPAEAAGAHSPPETATKPPSSQAPAGAPTPKKP